MVVLPCGAMRGFGVVQACFAHESQLDLLAEACGLDPVEVRVRNAIRTGDRLITGQVLRNVAPVERCLRETEALPFPDEARDDPSHLVVVTWDGPVSASAQSFDPARFGPERLQWRSHELYAYYPDGQGRSKLTLPILEKAAGRRGTARNWNTALALDALVRERE